jgi:hypothetical protein
MKQCIEMPADQVEMLCLDFTATVEIFGEKQTIDLKEGGDKLEVNGSNIVEYIALQVLPVYFLHACMQYIVLSASSHVPRAACGISNYVALCR